MYRPRNTPGQAPTGLSLITPLAYPVRRGGRGYNSNAPTELHFIYNITLSVKSVDFTGGRLKLFRIKEMIWEKEPRRGDTIITPGETGGYKEVLELRAP